MVTPRSRLSFAVSFFFTTFFTTLAVVLIAGADGVIDVESGSRSDCSVALCWGSGGGMAAALRAASAASASCSAERDKRVAHDYIDVNRSPALCRASRKDAGMGAWGWTGGDECGFRFESIKKEGYLCPIKA